MHPANRLCTMPGLNNIIAPACRTRASSLRVFCTTRCDYWHNIIDFQQQKNITCCVTFRRAEDFAVSSFCLRLGHSQWQSSRHSRPSCSSSCTIADTRSSEKTDVHLQQVFELCQTTQAPRSETLQSLPCNDPDVSVPLSIACTPT